MNVGSSILLLALLTLGGTPADGEILEDFSGLAPDDVTTETNTETKDPQELNGSMKDDEVPILLRMFPGGEYRSEADEDVGEPLIFNNSKLGNVKDDFLVKLPELAEIATSYAGYITVNMEYNSNLFFWYFEAEKPNAPVIMWLQGGPGASSMFGLFVEHGPFVVVEDLILISRASWAKGLYHVVYVDQPVGTGFSYTDNEEGYARNQDDVAEDLYPFILQFLDIFGLLHNDFYIMGESYAAKYIPAIAYKIHTMNEDPKSTQIRFAGIAMGAGITKPTQQMNYGNFLYQLGFIDEDDRKELISMNVKLQELSDEEKWSEATQEFHKMTSFYEEKTGLTNMYNYVHPGKPKFTTDYPKYLNEPKVRKAIHVGNQPYNDVSKKVYQHLYDDITKSMAPTVQKLLDEGYKVMIYSGQLDAVVPYAETEQYIWDLEWHGQLRYQKAKREIWRMNWFVAGYMRKVGKFWEVMVRNAGHIVPYERSKLAFDMYNRFIAVRPYLQDEVEGGGRVKKPSAEQVDGGSPEQPEDGNGDKETFVAEDGPQA